MDAITIIGAWVAAGLTLCIFSFLYKDNPFFKFGEHIYIGVSLGYGLSLLIFSSLIPVWYVPLFKERQLVLIIPTILGLLLLTRFSPKYSWLSKISFAFIMGFGAGTSIPRTISSYLLQQTQATVRPLVTKGAEGLDWSAAAIFNDISIFLIAIGVLMVLIYFFFSIEHKGPIRVASKIGIVFLMISFGASFGYTAMARMSLLYGRCKKLYIYSSADYYYATYIILAIIVISVVLFEVFKKRLPSPEKAAQ